MADNKLTASFLIMCFITIRTTSSQDPAVTTTSTTPASTTTEFGLGSCRPDVTCYDYCPNYAPCLPPKECRDGLCMGCPGYPPCTEDEFCVDGSCVVLCGDVFCQPGDICNDDGFCSHK